MTLFFYLGGMAACLAIAFFFFKRHGLRKKQVSILFDPFVDEYFAISPPRGFLQRSSPTAKAACFMQKFEEN